MRYLIIVLIGFFMISCTTLKTSVDVYKGDLPPLTSQSIHLALNIMNHNLFKAEKRNMAFEYYMGNLKIDFIEFTKAKYEKTLPSQENYKNKSPEEIKVQAKENAESEWLDDKGKNGISILIREEWEKYDAGAQNVYNKAIKSYQFSSMVAGLTLKDESLKAFRILQGAYDHYMSTLNPEVLFNNIDELLFKGKNNENSFNLNTVDGYSKLNDLWKIKPGIAASELVKGKVVGYPLFNPMIAYVSRNNIGTCSDWENFNSTIFRTIFGNAQFVAVREGLLVFNSKALDFDPTPIVGAGTATAKLGVKLAGAIAEGTLGIPHNMLSTDKESAAQSSSGGLGEYRINQVDNESIKATINYRTQARVKMLSELGLLLEKIEEKQYSEEKKGDVLKEYQRIIYFYLGQLSLSEE